MGPSRVPHTPGWPSFAAAPVAAPRPSGVPVATGAGAVTAAQLHGAAAAKAAQEAQMHGAAAAQAAKLAQMHGAAAAHAHAASYVQSGYEIPQLQGSLRQQPQQVSTSVRAASPARQPSYHHAQAPQQNLQHHQHQQRYAQQSRPYQQAAPQPRVIDPDVLVSPVRERSFQASLAPSSQVEDGRTRRASLPSTLQPSFPCTQIAETAQRASVGGLPAGAPAKPVFIEVPVSTLLVGSTPKLPDWAIHSASDESAVVPQSEALGEVSAAWSVSRVDACVGSDAGPFIDSPTPSTSTVAVLRIDNCVGAADKSELRAEVEARARALKGAIDADDAAVLHASMSQAVTAGVSAELLEEARQRLVQLEEDSWRARVRQSAEQALPDALRDGTLAVLLKTAIGRAAAAQADEVILEPARQELERRRARHAAEARLHAVLQTAAQAAAGIDSDVVAGAYDTASELVAAVAAAEGAGCAPELVSYAKIRLGRLEEYVRRSGALERAEQALAELASSGSDTAALGEALEAAREGGVFGPALQAARRRKMVLDARDRKDQVRELVTKRLEDAMCYDGAESLRAAVAYAQALGVSEAELGRPRQRLDELEEALASHALSAVAPVQAADKSQSAAALTPRRGQEILKGLQASPMPGRPPLPSPTTSTRPSSRPSAVPSVVPSVAPSAEAPERVVGVGGVQACIEAATASTTRAAERSPRPRSNSLREEVPSYGLDAELKAKAAAKYDISDEDEAARWIELLTGAEVAGDFFAALRSGRVLCELVNAINPGVVSRVNADGKPFKERENICNFLKACRTLGVQEYALFSTDDLYEENNLLSVVRCIHSLGGAVQRSVPTFTGPHFGVADTSKTKRDQKRDMLPATQTGGLHVAMERSHVDMVTGQIVRGGC